MSGSAVAVPPSRSSAPPTRSAPDPDCAPWPVPARPSAGGGVMSRVRMRSYLGPLIVVLVLSVVGLGSVVGSIPNKSDGRFHACFVQRTGAVRLIDYPKVKTCP